MFSLPTRKSLLIDQKEGTLFDTNTNLLNNSVDLFDFGTNIEKEEDFLHNFKNKKFDKNATFSNFESFCNFVENKNTTKQENEKNTTRQGNEKNTTKQENKFNPYEDNSGTTIALKQDDYIIVAADTRLCSEMGIYSRNTTKIFLINDFCITIAGFYADGVELYNRLKYEVLLYEAYNKINIHSLANLISKILYSRRFFPYYSYVSLSGFTDGKPWVYGFDCIGNFEELNCVCNGSGSSLAQPLLDSFIDKKNWYGDSPNVTEEYALNVVRTAFDSAAERDVKTGDNLEIYVINKEGMRRSLENLRGD